MLVTGINAALRDGPAMTIEQAKAELGADAERVVRGANALLADLDRRGVPGLREALDRSGAGNDVRLLRRLAALAEARGLMRPR